MPTLHAFVCMLEWFGCLGGLIYGFVEYEKYKWLTVLCFVMIILIPILNEAFLCLKGACCKRRVQNKDFAERHGLKDCVPIVYSANYNITACGIEKLHPFDSCKYGRIFQDLIESGTIDLQNMKVHRPTVPPREFL